jgi:AAA15 family ATPase/GTPase
MLEEITIKNFKSITDDTISLGRVNVFIGENGSGKSNILEALMFASVAETYSTIDADILSNNGVRVSKPSLMLSSFEGKKQKDFIDINLKFTDADIDCQITPLDKDNILSDWESVFFIPIEINKNKTKNRISLITYRELEDSIRKLNSNSRKQIITQIDSAFENNEYNKAQFKKTENFKTLNNFIIYTLNTEALRGIPEFQRSRKGIYGETLDIIVGGLNKEQLAELKQYLYTITWLSDIFIDNKDELKAKGYKLNQSKSLLYFKDKYMMKRNNTFSVENANEGVLHVLFYLALLINSKTPRLFAIDNIETALNPHLCRHLITEMCKLAKQHEKQLLITTHNPAILDGLDLFDDEVRLFEVKRLDNGNTKTRRIQIKPQLKNENYKLSELWMRGYLGAISQNF